MTVVAITLLVNIVFRTFSPTPKLVLSYCFSSAFKNALSGLSFTKMFPTNVDKVSPEGCQKGVYSTFIFKMYESDFQVNKKIQSLLVNSFSLQSNMISRPSSFSSVMTDNQWQTRYHKCNNGDSVLTVWISIRRHTIAQRFIRLM